MLHKIAFLMLVLALGLIIAVPAFAKGGRAGTDLTIYVTGQNLVFESIVTADLPPNGPFQQLFPPGTNPDHPDLEILSTEFGPGDPGYVGGRWWVDANGNGEMDGEDDYFLCPLLGPGQ